MPARAASLLLILLTLFAPAHAAAPTCDWRLLIWPAHRWRVSEAHESAESVLRHSPAKKGAAENARTLLARAKKPMPLGKLAGRWRVRSIQVSPLGAYAYPFFRARITAAGDGYRFEKTRGSQRRNGWLLPMPDAPDSLAFLGEATVNEDPALGYSRLRDSGVEQPAPGDSAGRLVRIGTRELLMILDADGEKFELYHLKH